MYLKIDIYLKKKMENIPHKHVLPQLAQNRDKIPVPAPTSRTTLFLNRNLF
jgi:hypothetical protein